MGVRDEMKRDWDRIRAQGPLVTRGRVLAFVMVIVLLCGLRMLPLAFPLFNVPLRACCSCVCKKESGNVCSGGKQSSYWTADCERLCRAACGKKGCGLKTASVLSRDLCGKLVPFH